MQRLIQWFSAAMQRQTAVTDYYSSDQLLLFAFARHNKPLYILVTFEVRLTKPPPERNLNLVCT